MTKQEMIESVCAKHRKQLGYSFDPEKVAEIINAGVIPEGHVFTVYADQTVKFEGGKINVYVNGELTKTVDDEKSLQGALMTYAYGASK